MSDLLGQALRFGAVGVINTAIGFALIVAAMQAGAPPVAANVAGYAGGLLVSFILNRALTFRRGEHVATWAEVLGDARRFAGAFAIAWLLNASVLWAGLRATDASPYLLQLAGVLTYSVSFFFLCRIWVFRQRA